MPTNTVVSIDRELPVGPSGAASEPQSDKDIVGDVELPVASFSAVGNGPARETAGECRVLASRLCFGIACYYQTIL